MPGASPVLHANPAWPGGPTTMPEDHAACNLTAGGMLAGESRGLPPLNCYGSVR